MTENFEKVADWYKNTTDQGDAAAQYCLVFAYYNGQSVTQDFEKAVEWWETAADQGVHKHSISLL